MKSPYTTLPATMFSQKRPIYRLSKENVATDELWAFKDRKTFKKKPVWKHAKPPEESLAYFHILLSQFLRGTISVTKPYCFTPKIWHHRRS